ncbi:hypothetical protein D3C79_857240 [compost metagenome]
MIVASREFVFKCSTVLAVVNIIEPESASYRIGLSGPSTSCTTDNGSFTVSFSTLAPSAASLPCSIIGYSAENSGTVWVLFGMNRIYPYQAITVKHASMNKNIKLRTPRCFLRRGVRVYIVSKTSLSRVSNKKRAD